MMGQSFNLVTQKDSGTILTESSSMHTIALTTLIFLPISTVAVSVQTQGPGGERLISKTDDLLQSILQLQPVRHWRWLPCVAPVLDLLDNHRPGNSRRAVCLDLLPS